MTASRNHFLVAMVILGGSFAILLALVWNGETNTADLALRNWALSFNTPTTVAIWEGISFAGSVIVLTGLTFLSLGLLAVRRDWLGLRYLAFSMGGAVGLNTIIKLLVHRSRPDEVYANTMPTSYSFPSGHALFSLTFFISVAIILSQYRRGNRAGIIWGVAAVMITLIGVSRIFLGVHYGSDVLGGYLIAALWLMFVTMVAPAGRHPHHLNLEA
ncbi:MAG TPA: phosphatase PAP2 family protein [Aestuariivirga sp.]